MSRLQLSPGGAVAQADLRFGIPGRNDSIQAPTLAAQVLCARVPYDKDLSCGSRGGCVDQELGGSSSQVLQFTLSLAFCPLHHVPFLFFGTLFSIRAAFLLTSLSERPFILLVCGR